jgi:hypothetical protein
MPSKVQKREETLIQKKCHYLAGIKSKSTMNINFVNKRTIKEGRSIAETFSSL